MVLVPRILACSWHWPQRRPAVFSGACCSWHESHSLCSLGQESGLHEFLIDTQKSLDRIGEEVVQTTMFYPAESEPGEQQQQQIQQ